MAITIRKGNRNDLKQIHKLVVELAVYEKEPEAVTATLSDYEEAYDEKRFEIIVAEEMKQIVGMMLYYPSYSTWKGKMIHLEDFVVTQSHRRRGIGELLFAQFLKEAKAQDAILTRWQVLDWNDPAIKFYKKIGATMEKEWNNCKIYL